MRIDVFDFDGTIYDGDSTVDCLRFALRERPWLAFCLLPPLFFSLPSLVARRFSLTAFKSRFFAALARHIDLGDLGRRFWADERTRSRVGGWFLARERRYPVIIASASPDFELRWAAEWLRADALICTRCDPKTGRLIGQNCKSSEKIRRIREELGDAAYASMYTDDPKADGPLLALAEERYLVTHGKVTRLD